MTVRGSTAAQSEGNGLRESTASCKIMHGEGDRTSVPVAPGGWGRSGLSPHATGSRPRRLDSLRAVARTRIEQHLELVAEK